MDTTKLYLYDADIGEPPANVPHCELCWDYGPGLVTIDGQAYCEYCQPEVANPNLRKYKNLVTPILGGDRISIYLDDADYARVNQSMRGVIVRDQDSGQTLSLTSAPCDVPGCNCDIVAEAMP